MSTIQFDWDEANLNHSVLHQVSPTDAEEVIRNRPCDLESQLRNGEERMVQIGETDKGEIVCVVTTTVGSKVRVITAWPAKERLRRYFLSQKRNGNVGRAKKQDLRE